MPPHVQDRLGNRVLSDCCTCETTLSLAFRPIRWVLVCLKCDMRCGERKVEPFHTRR